MFALKYNTDKVGKYKSDKDKCDKQNMLTRTKGTYTKGTQMSHWISTRKILSLRQQHSDFYIYLNIYREYFQFFCNNFFFCAFQPLFIIMSWFKRCIYCMLRCMEIHATNHGSSAAGLRAKRDNKFWVTLLWQLITSRKKPMSFRHNKKECMIT